MKIFNNEEKESIKKLYISGLTPKEIKEKIFKNREITSKQIGDFVSRKNLKRKKEKISEKVEKKIEEQIIDIKARTNNKHNELYNKTIEATELLLEEFMQEIENRKNGDVEDKKLATPYQLETIVSILNKLQKGQRLALNITEGEGDSDEVEPPMFVVEGLDVRKI